MKILGIDLGTARTGFAVSDKSGFLASPVSVFEEKNLTVVAKKAVKTAAELECGQIVIGLAKNMDGSEGDSATRTRTFYDEVKKRTKIPVILWDERLTTVQAQRLMISAGLGAKHRRQNIDSAAATVILQSYLDSKKPL